MKLLEDMPSAVAEGPARRREAATLATAVALLLVAAISGIILLITSGGSNDSTTLGDGAEDSGVALADWVEGAGSACSTIAGENAILTQGPAVRLDPGNVAAIDTGARALAAAIREMPIPSDASEAAHVSDAVAQGDQADQAWYGLATSTAVPTAEQLAEASALLTAFVTSLTELGADCSALA